eukprot:GILJ01010059.1.p2 GENE.GILJ01010059.1~~GILJ01010059.1.p2  ORF type:complete len:452 (-),score=45.52 GILJ01010059.1:130-1485(-)
MNTTLSMSESSDVPETVPIRTIHPLLKTRWTIKARVTARSELKTWSKNGRSGKLFYVNLLDAEGGELRGVFFDEAADRWSSTIELNSVYLFSRGKLKIADRRFCHASIQYECIWEHNAEISQVSEDDTIEPLSFAFVSIDKVMALDTDMLVDVLGVVHNVGPVGSVTIKSSGQQRQKRSVTLVDESCVSLILTLWGSLCDHIPETGKVIATRACRVSTFHGKSLSTTDTTYIDWAPSSHQAMDLQEWYNTTGKTVVLMSNLVDDDAVVRKTIGQINEEQKKDNYPPHNGNIESTFPSVWCKAFAIFVAKRSSDRPIWYTACPKCHRKVAENCQGWCCEACQHEYQEPETRYVASIMTRDSTGTNYFNIFNDAGNVLFGCSASEMKSYDSHALDACFEQANFKQYLFKIRPKEDMYAGQSRVRLHVLHVEPLDFVAESRLFVHDIHRYLKLV